MPIYKVTTEVNGAAQKRFVDAPTKSQAINHVTRSGVVVDVLTASQLFEAIQAGAIVEQAVGANPAPLVVTEQPIDGDNLVA